MNTKHIFAVLILYLTQIATANALEVFACEPEWAALTEIVGGDQVQVFTATSALQDPHHIEARPSLIARLRQADLLVCTGADLETAWLPMLQRKAGNPKVQVGQAGYFLAADYVQLKDIPDRLDRSEGDVHALGNPHIHTDPRNIGRVAVALADRLAQIDPEHAQAYRSRQADFAQRWAAAIERWQALAAPLRGLPIVVEHDSWVYLQDWLGLDKVATLEPKPGVPPSSAYLSEVLSGLQAQPAKLVLYAAYQDGRPSHWLADKTAVRVVELPFTVGGNRAAQDLFTLFDDTLARLLGQGE